MIESAELSVMQGARVLARALAAAGRQRLSLPTKLQGEFSHCHDGLGFLARRPPCRDLMGAATIHSFTSSSLFPKVLNPTSVLRSMCNRVTDELGTYQKLSVESINEKVLTLQLLNSLKDWTVEVNSMFSIQN